jgi:hypothetical protein
MNVVLVSKNKVGLLMEDSRKVNIILKLQDCIQVYGRGIIRIDISRGSYKNLSLLTCFCYLLFRNSYG